MASLTFLDFSREANAKNVAKAISQVSSSQTLLVISGLESEVWQTSITNELTKRSDLQRVLGGREDSSVWTLALRNSGENVSRGVEVDCFNPFDALPHMGPSMGDSISRLLDNLSFVDSEQQQTTVKSFHEPVWGVLAAEVLHAGAWYLAQRKPASFTLSRLAGFFFADDFWNEIKRIIDNEGMVIERHVHNVFQAAVKREDQHKGLIMAHIHQRFARMRLRSFQDVVEKTSVNLSSLAAGLPQTIHIQCDVSAHADCANILQMWITALLQICVRLDRPDIPKVHILVAAPAHAALNNIESTIAKFAQVHPAIVDFQLFTDSIDQFQNGPFGAMSGAFSLCSSVGILGPLHPYSVLRLASYFDFDISRVRSLSHDPPEHIEIVPRVYKVSGAAGSLPQSSCPQDLAMSGNVVMFTTDSTIKTSIAAQALKEPGLVTVIFDPSGAFYRATTTQGNNSVAVRRLDPFGVFGAQQGDKFNPLDLLKLNAGDPFVVAELIMSSGAPSVDAFWSNSSKSLIAAVIQYLNEVPEKSLTFAELRRTFYSDDVVYNLAVVLDTIGKRLPPACYQEIAGFLQLPDNTRSTVLCHVSKALHLFGSPLVDECVSNTTIDFDSLSRNGDATLFLAVPTYCASSYAQLARLWLESLLLILTRSGPVGKATVRFIVDSASSFGLRSFVETALAKASSRCGDTPNYVELWGVWDDLLQLQYQFPSSWQRCLECCRRVLVSGPTNRMQSRHLAATFGIDEKVLGILARGQTYDVLASRVSVHGDAFRGHERKSTESARPITIRRNWEAGGHNTITIVRSSNEVISSLVFSSLRGEHSATIVVTDVSGRWFEPATSWASNEGIKCVALDPFGATLGQCNGGTFNPFDVLRGFSQYACSDISEIVDCLLPLDPATIDPFWRTNTKALMSGVLQYLREVPDKEFSVGALRELLASDDVVYNLAVVLDTIGKKLPVGCYQEISAFLQRADSERLSLIAIALQATRIFGEPAVAQTVNMTSFDIEGFLGGDPLLLYMTVPPSRMRTHSPLIRLWMRGMLALLRARGTKNSDVSSARWIVEDSLLLGLQRMILSEQQTLQYDAAFRQSKAPHVTVWSFWDNLRELDLPEVGGLGAWLASSQIVQAFGPQARVSALQLADVFGADREKLRRLGPSERYVFSENDGY